MMKLSPIERRADHVILLSLLLGALIHKYSDNVVQKLDKANVQNTVILSFTGFIIFSYLTDCLAIAATQYIESNHLYNENGQYIGKSMTQKIMGKLYGENKKNNWAEKVKNKTNPKETVAISNTSLL